MSEVPDNTERMAAMREKLAALEPVALEIKDESHRHAGHEGAKSGMGHFALTIASAAFDGKSTLERHRLVYETLGEMMHTDIHALSIRALTPADIGES